MADVRVRGPVVGPAADGGPSPPLSPNAGKGDAPVEVETEYEDEEADHGYANGPAIAAEVEEELEPDATGDSAVPTPVAAGKEASIDYVLPEKNREVWKNFGYDNEAGRILRRLYNQKGQVDGALKVSYPQRRPSSSRWEPPSAERKPCPQRAAVRVPKLNRHPTPDPNDPRNWRAPVPCRKPAAEIFAEMEMSRPEVPNLKAGRDQLAEKSNLQERFQFCGGRAMPRGAMGHVEPGEMPKAVQRRAQHSHDPANDGSNMTLEQRGIFEELMLDVKTKQARLAEIDAEEVRNPAPSKAKTARNKEALVLRNAIQGHLRDIDTLLEITEQ